MFSLHNSTVSWENSCLAPVLVQSHLQWGPIQVHSKFWSEWPAFNGWLESNLVHFLAHDFLNSPHQPRAIWAGSAAFADTGRLVIHRNYWLTMLSQGEKAKSLSKFGQVLAFSPDYNLIPWKFPRMTTRRLVSTKGAQWAPKGSNEQGKLQPSLDHPCSWLTRRPSPTRDFLSWLSALCWDGPSHCHSQKLSRNQVVVRWKGRFFFF